jgi:isoquinoline 1-oxidoreductase beta subunit
MAMAERALIDSVSRRAFLKGMASGVGFVVGLQMVPFNGAVAFEQYPTHGLDMPPDPHVSVSIDPDGTVTIVAHPSKIVAGSKTSLPMRCETGKAMAHTRVAWFRSVSNIPRAFAIQSFVAELAHELGGDQKDYLLELIGPARIIDPKASGFPEDFWNYGEPYDEFPIDTARLKNVVNIAADAAGWGKELPAGEGLGIAAHRSFVTYVASVVRVKVGDDGTVRVPEVHTAVDCGFVANPERIRSQIEGAAVMGMTIALNSAITFENGRVVQSNFHDYDVARADNFPGVVYTYIVGHPFSVHATGVGEPAVPPFAPALYNAIFNATGKRLRSLPLADQLKA